jgi:hypothetical protein
MQPSNSSGAREQKCGLCAQGIVRVKNMRRKGEGDEKGDAVRRDALVQEMRARIAALGSEHSLLTKPPAPS